MDLSSSMTPLKETAAKLHIFFKLHHYFPAIYEKSQRKVWLSQVKQLPLQPENNYRSIKR